jgi:hypothetical protein
LSPSCACECASEAVVKESLLYCQFNDPIAWIEFVHRLAPSSGGKFDCEIRVANKIERFIDDSSDFRTGAMTMNLDKIEMSKAID